MVAAVAKGLHQILGDHAGRHAEPFGDLGMGELVAARHQERPARLVGEKCEGFDQGPQFVTVDRLRFGRRAPRRPASPGRRRSAAVPRADVCGEQGRSRCCRRRAGDRRGDRGSPARSRCVGDPQPRLLDGLFRDVDRTGPAFEDGEQRAPLLQVDAGKLVSLQGGSHHGPTSLPNPKGSVVPTLKHELSRHVFSDGPSLGDRPSAFRTRWSTCDGSYLPSMPEAA